MEEVSAVELLRIRLNHRQSVLISFKNFYFISELHSTPDEVSLPCHKNVALRVLNADSLVIVRVLEDDVGDPNVLHLLTGENVQRLVLFEVVELGAVLKPFQCDLVLERNGVVHL